MHYVANLTKIVMTVEAQFRRANKPFYNLEKHILIPFVFHIVRVCEAPFY